MFYSVPEEYEKKRCQFLLSEAHLSYSRVSPGRFFRLVFLLALRVILTFLFTILIERLPYSGNCRIGIRLKQKLSGINPRKRSGKKLRGDYPNRIIASNKNKKSKSILLIKELKRYKNTILKIIKGGIMTYSPKVREDLVKKLYLIKHSTPDKTPMTSNIFSIKTKKPCNLNNYKAIKVWEL